ncbi:hypothetical protein [Ideonella sp.]|uniref:hypothetical protein n=1 Tax=Ideonella sp. TaxID=1929293 RepID=UPI00351B0D83
MPTHDKEPACRRTRVVKTIRPDQRGALKLEHRYGDVLVCVRYRQDPLGLQRYTTVELVVDEGPVMSARTDQTTVAIRLGSGEHALRNLVRVHGATRDSATGLWHMPRRLARTLGLLWRTSER